MQPSDRPEFVRVLNGLAAVKPGKGLTPEALDVWWLALRDWPLADFRAAAGHLARTVEFMPSPYHFAQLRKAGRPTSAEAWELAWKGNPTNDYAIAKALAVAAGSERLGMIELTRLPWVEKRFREAYDELVDVVEHREALPHLTDSEAIRCIAADADSRPPAERFRRAMARLAGGDPDAQPTVTRQ